jgi:cysteine-S-conjugate beta-lyase
MWVADMDFETVPEVKDAIIKRAMHGIYGYTARSDEYYQAVIDWNKKRFKWDIEKKWITHSSGIVNGVYNIIRAFTNPGDGVVIQPPVYHPFYFAIKKSKRELVLNPLKFENEKYVPDLEDFEVKLKKGNVKLFILCNPHNPVGRVFTKEELTALGDLCLKYKVLVVSDEIHSDLVYKSIKHFPFASLSKDFQENSITCTAPSKTFNLAGLSTSNIIIPNDELKVKYDYYLESHGIKTINIFGLIACETAYRLGGEWLEELLDYLESNKNYALDFINKRTPILKANETEGTYFLWVDCRALGFKKEELEKFMINKARLWFNQGYIFGEEGEGFVRINFACRRSTLDEALNRLENSINSHEI